MKKRLFMIALVVVILGATTTVVVAGPDGPGGPLFDAIVDLQNRVAALEAAQTLADLWFCGEGNVAKFNATNGIWECAKDDDTTYLAGNQLELDEAQFQFNVLEGSGSDLDADMLDGKDSAAFTYGAGDHLQLVDNQFSVVDGSGSGLDADTLDGQDSAAFTYSAGDHLQLADNQFSVVDGSGSGLDADTLDGMDSTHLDADTLDGMDSEDFLYTDDLGRVYNDPLAFMGRVQIGEWGSGDLAVSGDLEVTGDFTVHRIDYSYARTHYLSIGQSAFQPEEARQYQLGFPEFGAFSELGATLVAPVYLPDGAVVREITCYFYDASTTADLSCDLKRHVLSYGGVGHMAGTDSDTSEGHVARSCCSGLRGVIENDREDYYILVTPDPAWPDVYPEYGMGIKGVVLRYELEEAP